MQDRAVLHTFVNNWENSQHILIKFSGNASHGTKENNKNNNNDNNKGSIDSANTVKNALAGVCLGLYM